MADRGYWGSKLGFVLAAAGAAVGLGNIWKFPYITGENGGRASVLIYRACIAGVGLPVMMAEILLGRATQKSPVGAIKALGGGFWVVFGGLGILGGVAILSYYSVVSGIVLARALRRNQPEPVKANGKWRNPIPVFRSEAASPIEESQPGRSTWNRTAIPGRMDRNAKGIAEWILSKVNGVEPAVWCRS